MGNCQCLNQDEKLINDDMNTSKENFRVRSGLHNLYAGGLYQIKEETDENKVSTMNNEPRSLNVKSEFMAIQTINDPEIQELIFVSQEPIVIQHKKSLKMKSVSNHFYEAPPKTSIREIEIKENNLYFPNDTEESKYEVDTSKLSKSLFNLLNLYKIKPKLLVDRLEDMDQSNFKSTSKEDILQFLNGIDNEYKGNSFIWDALTFINLRNLFIEKNKTLCRLTNEQIEKEVLDAVLQDNHRKYIYSFRCIDKAEDIFNHLISNHFSELRHLLVNNSIDHACTCSTYLNKSEIFTSLILFSK